MGGGGARFVPGWNLHGIILAVRGPALIGVLTRSAKEGWWGEGGSMKRVCRLGRYCSDAELLSTEFARILHLYTTICHHATDVCIASQVISLVYPSRLSDKDFLPLCSSYTFVSKENRCRQGVLQWRCSTPKTPKMYTFFHEGRRPKGSFIAVIPPWVAGITDRFAW